MNCHEARRHWNLYYDSEGDSALHFEISEHLAICPHCAEWFSQQSRLEELIAEKLAPRQPTAPVWEHVLGKCGLVQPVRAGRWLLLSGIAACAMVALGAVLWYGSGLFQPNEVAMAPTSPDRGAGFPDLAKLTAQWHQRLTAGDEPLQIRSESDLEVEGYLRQRVSFPVRCPPRKDAGFAVQGAGTCQLGQQSAAFLLGQVEEAPVSIFILPRTSLEAFPHQWEAIRRHAPHHCREGQLDMVMALIDRNVVLVIGQAMPDRLLEVLNAYGTYPDHQPG